MDEEEINYRTLRRIQQQEKNSPVLTDIKTEFYTDLAEYLKSLNIRFEKETDSQKKMLLKDEIQNTKKIAVNIYEQREKKILLTAVSKARGGNPNFKNMLADEEVLFNSILESMEKSRNVMLENKKCIDKKNIEEEKVEETKSATDDKVKLQKQQDSEGKTTTTNSNPILLVNQNIPEFVGTDTKKYNLRKNDIISTPKDMANMLCSRDAVEKLEL